MVQKLSVVVGSLVLVAACGGAAVNRDQSLARLRSAIEAPVGTSDQAAEHSRLVEDVLESGVLDDMFRREVEERIGRGDPCSRHPRCLEAGFADDDWFYTVGQMGEGSVGAIPVMVVGFDHTGRVTRTWNLRTH